MSFSGMVVLVPSELASGFGLAGVETVTAEDEAEAATALHALMSGEGRALVAVYQPFLLSLDDQEREAAESSLEPVVVPLPAGLARYDEEGHRARISAMLSRAVGYHITFGARSER